MKLVRSLPSLTGTQVRARFCLAFKTMPKHINLLQPESICGTQNWLSRTLGGTENWLSGTVILMAYFVCHLLFRIAIFMCHLLFRIATFTCHLLFRIANYTRLASVRNFSFGLVLGLSKIQLGKQMCL